MKITSIKIKHPQYNQTANRYIYLVVRYISARVANCFELERWDVKITPFLAGSRRSDEIESDVREFRINSTDDIIYLFEAISLSSCYNSVSTLSWVYIYKNISEFIFCILDSMHGFSIFVFINNFDVFGLLVVWLSKYHWLLFTSHKFSTILNINILIKDAKQNK